MQARKLALWKRILFPVVTLCLVTLLLEGGLRLFGLRNGFIRGLKRVSYMPPEVFAKSIGMWRPNATGRVGWPTELAFDFEIDPHGFRGYPPEKDDPKYRILCLGDSTTFSLFVDEANTYPRQLELELQRRGFDVQVYNGGSPNWGTHDHVRFLRARAHKIEPDFVVHLYCTNDHEDIEDDPEGDRSTFVRWQKRIEGGMSLFEYLRVNTALGELHARLNVFWKAWRQGPTKAIQLGMSEVPTAQGWRPFEQAHGALAAECKKRGYGLLTACFPDPGNGATSPHEEGVRKIAEAQGVPFVPLWKTFRTAEARGETLYNLPIDAHANANGCLLIAKTIATHLEKARLGPYAAAGK